MATDLLNRALAINEEESGGGYGGLASDKGVFAEKFEDGWDTDLELERQIMGLKEVQQNRVSGRRRRRIRREMPVEDMSAFGESMMVDSDD